VLVMAPDQFRTFDSLLKHINASPLADPSVLKKVSLSPALFQLHTQNVVQATSGVSIVHAVLKKNFPASLTDRDNRLSHYFGLL